VLGAKSWIAREAVMPAIQKSNNGRLAAVASRDPASIRDAGNGVRVLTYEQLVAADSVDAIYIPLPNSLHFEWAKRAAEEGKSVLCEKPLAINAQEAEALADIFERCGTGLMEGFMYRFHPQHRRVRELIDAGAIGDIREVRAHLSVDLMNPADPDNVRFKAELGGGALLDMGCYCVSAARMLLDDEPSAVSGWWRIDDRFGIDVAAAGILEFPRGRVATVSCSFNANGNGFYTVIGRDGMIEVPRALILGAGTRLGEAIIIVVDADGHRREENLPAINQYQALVEAFAGALLSNGPMPIPLSDSINNARALDAFALSAAEGRRVTISPFAKGDG